MHKYDRDAYTCITFTRTGRKRKEWVRINMYTCQAIGTSWNKRTGGTHVIVKVMWNSEQQSYKWTHKHNEQSTKRR